MYYRSPPLPGHPPLNHLFPSEAAPVWGDLTPVPLAQGAPLGTPIPVGYPIPGMWAGVLDPVSLLPLPSSGQQEEASWGVQLGVSARAGQGESSHSPHRAGASGMGQGRQRSRHHRGISQVGIPQG